jgi:hypothetical protein
MKAFAIDDCLILRIANRHLADGFGNLGIH